MKIISFFHLLFSYGLPAFFVFASQILLGMDRANFERMISQPPPQWMVDQIQEDLEPFDNELSCAALDQLFAEQGDNVHLTRVQIRNGQIQYQYSSNSRTHCVTPWITEGLEKLNAMVSLPDIDFVFTSADTINSNELNWPIFAESKNGPIPGILFPDRWALKGYIPEKTDVLAGNTIYPWEQKIPILFFRGSDTARDPGTNWARWDFIPRVLLVRLSLIRPDLIDAKFVHSLHNVNKIPQARREGLITDTYFPLRDHPRYKYLMDLDGNCASCPRTAAIFHSNSVIFKEVSPSKQWWYSLIKPYEHYIPVSGDLSDVISQIEWAKAHDDECRKISKNARNLVLDVLSEERIYQFLYELLMAYAEKQKAVYH